MGFLLPLHPEMNQNLKITLRPGKENAIMRRHPWVFSGAIKHLEGQAFDGAIARVFDHKGAYLATGVFQDATIMVRILEFAPTEIHNLDEGFWTRKIKKALDNRLSNGIATNKETNVYRLVHGEGDQLPGLIIDYFDGHLAIQAHATGIHTHINQIANAIKLVFGSNLKSITDKSGDTLPKGYLNSIEFSKNLYGEAEKVLVTESGYKFIVDIGKGQKTGFFIDQRENRKLLSQYCAGKKILNTFCYSGGFSVYALGAGAREVYSTDSSKKAIELCDENVKLNFGNDPRHTCLAFDTMQFIRQSTQEFDVIVLDPPAYAKHQNARHNAVQGYKRLNLEAMKRIKPGGIIFTFSCSQVVDMTLFRGALLAASIEAGRQVRILHQMSQPADHPIGIFHPEGEYLKGLVLMIDD